MSAMQTYIELNGIEFDVAVDYDFQPPEPFDSDTGYPGCDAAVTVTGVESNAIDITNQLTTAEIDELAQRILEWEMMEEGEQ